MNLIDKVWNKNKVIWHRRFNMFGFSGIELHHGIPGRVGIAKCCLKLFERAKPGHQDDPEFVERVREEKRPYYEAAKANYVKGLGCKEKIFKECDFCAMPKRQTDIKHSWSSI